MKIKKKTQFLAVSIFLGGLFLVLSFFVNKDVFRDLDYNVLVGMQGIFTRVIDLPFSLLTLLGSSEVILTAIAAIFLFVLWKKKCLFAGIFLVFSIYAIELAGKLFIYHPKPPIIFNRYALNIFMPSSFIVDTNYSYPSGHMARMTFIVVVLTYLLVAQFKLKVKPAIIYAISAIFILLIFISRIYLAEHWFSDVVGGLLLGGSLATLSISFW